MKFCQEHWDGLRTRIEARGLGDLIAPSGETAAAQAADQIERAEVTLTNFDPLMSAHWAIASNAMETISRAGASPLYLMGDGDEDPIDPTVYGPAAEGRTWPRCPLCYLNIGHELTCEDERCALPKVGGYDWMLDRAADDAKATADRLRSSRDA